MEKKNLLKRLLVTVVISTELITTTVYAADMNDAVVYENQEEQIENNVVEQPAKVQPPQAMPDVMTELNATGSTSINAVDLLGDNPSINISVPNNAVTPQAITESETTVETELVQRDLVYKRKDVTITATGMFPKDATLELVESNKITDLVQYKGDTETRKLYDTLFNYNIKINIKVQIMYLRRT